MRNSRSPKRHSKYEVAPEDLCIKLDVLADRLEVLEADNKALKDAVKELQQWKSWLWLLYHWLHRFFYKAPKWPDASPEGDSMDSR